MGGPHEGDEDREHEGEEGGGPHEGDEDREHEGEEGGGPRDEGDEAREHEGEEGGGPRHEGHEVSSWDGGLPLVRSGSLVRATAPVCGRLHTLVERGRHVPSLWIVEHGLLYAGSDHQRTRISESECNGTTATERSRSSAT